MKNVSKENRRGWKDISSFCIYIFNLTYSSLYQYSLLFPKSSHWVDNPVYHGAGPGGVSCGGGRQWVVRMYTYHPDHHLTYSKNQVWSKTDDVMTGLKWRRAVRNRSHTKEEKMERERRGFSSLSQILGAGYIYFYESVPCTQYTHLWNINWTSSHLLAWIP